MKTSIVNNPIELALGANCASVIKPGNPGMGTALLIPGQLSYTGCYIYNGLQFIIPQLKSPLSIPQKQVTATSKVNQCIQMVF